MKRSAAVVATLVAVLAACSPGASGAPPPAGAVIEVASELGDHDAERAVAAAVASHPTVRGYRLAYRSLDDKLAGNFDLDKAIQNARLETRDHQILGVIGPWNSPVAQVLVPITGQADLVTISPSNTEDCLTARPKACLVGPDAPAAAQNYFRIAAPDSVAAENAADFAVGKLGIKRFAVLHEEDPFGFGLSTAQAFSSEVVNLGARVVFDHSYSATAVSYAELLRDARAAGAEAVYLGGSQNLGACRVRAAMSGIFPPDTYFISGDGILGSDCIADAGSEADDHLVAAVSAREPASVPAALDGIKRGRDTDAYNFAAYDCAQILIEAIDRAIQKNGGKVPTREQVLGEVAGTSDFRGVTGTYSFAANGDATRPAVSFYHVAGGSWTFWQNAA